MADHPNVLAMPNGSDGERSLWYRSGQAILTFVLGLALAVAAMALFFHGVAVYNNYNRSRVPTNPPAKAQVHNP